MNFKDCVRDNHERAGYVKFNYSVNRGRYEINVFRNKFHFKECEIKDAIQLLGQIKDLRSIEFRKTPRMDILNLFEGVHSDKVVLSQQNMGKSDGEIFEKIINIMKPKHVQLNKISTNIECAEILSRALRFVKNVTLHFYTISNGILPHFYGLNCHTVKFYSLIQIDTNDLFNFLKSLSNLHSLYFNRCLDNRHVIGLGDFLTSCQTIKMLIIKHNPIGNNGLRVISESLLVNKSLVKLSLVNIGATSLDDLVKNLECNQNLKFIDLSLNNFSNQYNVVPLRNLLALRLYKIVMSKCNLSNTDFNNNLAYDINTINLTLNDNNVDDHSVQILSESFPSSRLKYLNLCNNQITQEGIKNISDNIEKSKIVGLMIDIFDGMSLELLLNKASKLSHISLTKLGGSVMDINDNDSAIISKFIKNSRNISFISFNPSEISESSARCLIDAFKESVSLKYIYKTDFYDKYLTDDDGANTILTILTEEYRYQKYKRNYCIKKSLR